MLVSLFSGILTLTSNLTTQPRQYQKTSKSTTREPLTSNLATRKTLTSKSLCHLKYHASGLVSTDRYFHDFYISDFYYHPSKSLYFKPFSHPTLSPLLSILPSQHELYGGTCPPAEPPASYNPCRPCISNPLPGLRSCRTHTPPARAAWKQSSSTGSGRIPCGEGPAPTRGGERLPHKAGA